MSNLKSPTPWAIVISLLSFTFPAQANTLPIEPGLWETTITSTSQSLGSRTETVQTCFDSEQYDAEKLVNEIVKTDDCEFQSNILGEVLEYTFNCEAEAGMVFGEGNVTTDGDTASGVMSMQMESESMSIGLNVSSQAKRVGDC